MKKICSKCGAVNSEKTIWCLNCGEGLKDAELVYENKNQENLKQIRMKKNRPTLINLFLIVYFLRVIFFIFSLGFLIYLGTVGTIEGNLSFLIFLISIFLLLIIVLLHFSLIYGIIKAKNGSWKIALSMLIIGMIFGVLNKDYMIIFGVFIDVLFLISFTTQNVRSNFI